MFFKKKLNWKRPLFYVLLPILLIMAFLGFPIPVAPIGSTTPQQEQSVTVKKKKRLRPLHAKDDEESSASPDP